jgi:hypothetical protein
MRYLPMMLLTAATALAGPTTRPKEVAPTNPPVVYDVGQVRDYTRPEYVPAFTNRPRPTLLHVERDYAYRLSPPAFGYYGCGRFGWGSPWLGGGGYYRNNGFYR